MDWRKNILIFFLIVCQLLYTSLARDGPFLGTSTGGKGEGKGSGTRSGKAVKPSGKGSGGKDGKEESGTDPTTTDSGLEVNAVTDMNIEDALRLEVGEYSTVSFSYQNDQYMNWFKPNSAYTCHDEYIKCILSQTVRHPICAMHRQTKKEGGYKHLQSLCDMHWYNCRRGYRFFFAMKYGVCAFYAGDGKFWYFLVY